VKLLIVFWLASGAATVCGGTSTNGSSVGLPELEVAWGATTNGWQERLWVYKVASQEFSPPVVSNLLAISGFTNQDRTNRLGEPPFRDKSILFFRNADQSKYLEINPVLGWIDYHDDKAEASSQKQKIEGVPNEQEATRLGFKYLRLCGIENSQIVKKPGTCDFDLHWEKGTLNYTDQETQKEITVTNNYGVFFDRCVDGVRVQGFGRGGGVRVRFGNKARIIDLQVCWRNLKPYELREVPPPEQITEQLRAGTIALHPLGSYSIYPAGQVRRLTVTKCTFFYEGKYQDEPMDFVRPYVSFEGTADTGQGETGVWFEFRL
jgi:hypothetical protein